MKKIYAILAWTFACLGCFAQTTLKVNAPELVAVDEQFNLTFIIEGDDAPSAFEWSASDDFQLVWGPQKGSSTSISIINGKRTKSSQTTYTYVLMPRRTGSFQLPAATATIKGSSVVSKRVSIQVVGNGSSAQQQQPQQSAQSQAPSRSQAASADGEDLFMRLSFSKTRVVVGETITATLKLYQRVNIAGFEDAKFPTFNGFWSQEMQAPTNIEFRRENVGDLIYNSAVLRSWSLVPQQSGDIRIDPAELVCLVNVRAPRTSSNSIFDSFFQDDYQTIRKRVTTPAVTIHVSPVPAGAPASFGGGVGSFRMSAALTRDSLSTHDAASLKITVSGKGNINLLEAPKVNFPPDFEVYDVKTSDASGSRVFEYPFIPRSHGEFTLGPIEYSYYDIAAGKYVTLTSDELPLKVARNESAASASDGGQMISAPARKDVRDLGSDIRFIKTGSTSFRRAGSYLVTSAIYWILFVVMLLAALVTYFASKGAAARRADVAGTRNRAAAKMARRRLARAGEFLSKDLYSAFYEELHKALLGFVSDKLDMKGMDMTKENIALRLQENGVSEGLASDFTALVDACEFARYAPSEGHDAMNAHYESAVSAISAIDESMGRKRRNGGVAAAMLMMFMLMPVASQAAEKQHCDSLWAAGNAAYAEGRWADAESAWKAVETTGYVSSDLYFNLGNAAYKQDDIAHAVLGYMRALKLDPSNSDAKFNLEFAQARVQDRIGEVPEFFLKTWLRKLCWCMSSNAWAVLSLVLLAAFLGMLLTFLLAARSSAKKAGFFSGIVLLILFAVCLRFAFWQRSDSIDDRSAVIVSPVVSVKSSPSGDSSTDLFVLHEGTCVRELDELGSWVNIELTDGRQGWIPGSNLETIWN